MVILEVSKVYNPHAPIPHSPTTYHPPLTHLPTLTLEREKFYGFNKYTGINRGCKR